MDVNLEQWKKISKFPSYEVSSFGRVRSLDRVCRSGPGIGIRNVVGKILKPFIVHSTGYMQIALPDRKKYSVHRLVAREFCDGWFEGAVVNHKNGIRSDNRAENLEWITSSENIKHSFEYLKRVPSNIGKFGKDSNTAKPVLMFKDGVFLERFDCGLDVVRKYSTFTSAGISRSASGKIKNHMGHQFKFENQHPR